MKIILYLYISDTTLNNLLTKQTINRHITNHIISEIVIFSTDVKYAFTNKLNHKKINIIHCVDSPNISHNDIFTHSRKNYPGDIIISCIDSSIYFDDSLALLNLQSVNANIYIPSVMVISPNSDSIYIEDYHNDKIYMYIPNNITGITNNLQKLQDLFVFSDKLKHESYNYNNIYNNGDVFNLRIANPTIKILPKMVISYCLYGDNIKYTEGAIHNAETALEIYPEWCCWFYVHIPSVPKEIIGKLQSYPNVKIIPKYDLVLAMLWRYLPMDDPLVNVMISRDTDSTLSIRERNCVYDWLKSDKKLHIIRDHPSHNHRIMGGTTGVKKMDYWKGWSYIWDMYPINVRHNLDQDILQEILYPLASKYNDIYVNASCNLYESDALDITTKIDDEYNIIGGYTILSKELRTKVKDTWLDAVNNENGKHKATKITQHTFPNIEISEDYQINVRFITSDKYQDIMFKLEGCNVPIQFIKKTLELLIPCLINNDNLIISNKNISVEYEELIKKYDNDRLILINKNEESFVICSRKIWLKLWGLSNIQNNELFRAIINRMINLWNNRVNPIKFLNEYGIYMYKKMGLVIELNRPVLEKL